MRMMRAVAMVAVAVGLMSGAAQAQQQSRWQTQGVRIATEGAYAPWNFSTPQGQLDGFEIELGNELCRRMSVRCTFVAQDWDGIIPSLNAGRYDVIMAGMNITDRRLEVVSFTRAYAGGPAGFGVPRTSPLAQLPGTGEQLNLATQGDRAGPLLERMREMVRGRTIGVQVSTVHSAFVQATFGQVATIREYRTTEQHDLDLQNGRIDAIWAAHSALTATFNNADFREFQIAGAGFSGGPLGRGVAAAVRKADEDLRAMFDQAIAAAIADGTVRTLSTKWFGIDMTPRD